MSLRILMEGSAHTILAFAKEDASCQVEDFLAGLQPRDRKKLVARIEHTANHVPPRNSEANKPVEGTKFFELKSHGHRIFWRWSLRNEVILMHGFVKRDERISSRDLEAGLRLFEAIEEELRN